MLTLNSPLNNGVLEIVGSSVGENYGFFVKFSHTDIEVSLVHTDEKLNELTDDEMLKKTTPIHSFSIRQFLSCPLNSGIEEICDQGITIGSVLMGEMVKTLMAVKWNSVDKDKKKLLEYVDAFFEDGGDTAIGEIGRYLDEHEGKFFTSVEQQIVN